MHVGRTRQRCEHIGGEGREAESRQMGNGCREEEGKRRTWCGVSSTEV